MTPTFSRSLSPRLAPALALTGLLVGFGATAAPAAAETIAGTWHGGGIVVLPSGERERARCRARFSHLGGRRFSMRAVCTTPNNRISQDAQLEQLSSSRYSGEFFNSEFSVTGAIRISVQGRRMSASLSGGGGTASFSMSR